MRLRIAARQSDLARLQAKLVGQMIQKQNPDCEIEYQFRASLGDLNQSDPLWQMPEKGVFTQDFLKDLLEERSDLIVHSWKDLPTEGSAETEIIATLPRADQRDLLLLRKDACLKIADSRRLRILTSSPRRAHNLSEFFRGYLPWEIAEVEFQSVRGNVPTRVRKLFSQDVDALIVAKAALDRLMGSADPEFAEVGRELRANLELCEWAVLPLTLNPAAAAQGALAIEIKRDAEPRLRQILTALNSKNDFECVQKEREILSSYGGGCHQKIGVSVLKREFGEVTFLRGLTDSGQVLDRACLASGAPDEVRDFWPKDPKNSLFFERVALPEEDFAWAKEAPFLWVAREAAWPENWPQSCPLRSSDGALGQQVIWTAGLRTWQKLARRGVWVNGSAESLGEAEPTRIETLLGVDRLKWTKLTHQAGHQHPEMKLAATYRLQAKVDAKEGAKDRGSLARQLQAPSHFFWMSGSSFDQARQIAPEIINAKHACGPGSTAEHLRQQLGANSKTQLRIYLSYEDWRAEMLTACERREKS
jgi:hydroxymethylbilane synthase